jgi:hypothetical protein
MEINRQIVTKTEHWRRLQICDTPRFEIKGSQSRLLLRLRPSGLMKHVRTSDLSSMSRPMLVSPSCISRAKTRSRPGSTGPRNHSFSPGRLGTIFLGGLLPSTTSTIPPNTAAELPLKSGEAERYLLNGRALTKSTDVSTGGRSGEQNYRFTQARTKSRCV